jgi:hypothetical protein
VSKVVQSVSSEQEIKFSALLKIRELDLSLHYLEKHKRELFRLPLGKGSMENRADYAVDLPKHEQPHYILWPIFLRKCFLSSTSFSASIPFDLNPSTTPSIARPCSVSTKIQPIPNLMFGTQVTKHSETSSTVFIK